ncbi:TfuA-like protein [Streptomyces sp. NPDC001594]|uniref:TfuA-like protein n=1 Tax=Streptomyces sp. NPDC001594 TaxID=3364590 RepID=UPI00367CA1C1
MPTGIRTIVTAGPTLTADDVHRLLPDAEVRPPVGADQVLRWGLRPGDRLLVVDGLFLHSRAVRHKELLALIDQGVEVYGAASMGALRAAELAPYGMTGIGAVFRAYRDGKIVGDDEVALLHADAEAGHRALSWALVDLRHAVEDACRREVVGPDTAELVIETATELPFTARDTATVLTSARARGADPYELDLFRLRYDRGGPRIKRRDALTALRLLALTPPVGPRVRNFPRGHLTYLGVPTPLSETVYLRSWRTTPLPDDCRASGREAPEPVGCEEVVEVMALTWAGFPAALRDIAAAQLLAGPPTGEGAARPAPPDSGWSALAPALTDRLAELDLPADPTAAGPYAALLRPRERELPWAQAGPLLATRLWHTTSRLDWTTPVIAALRDHPVFTATAKALTRARAEEAGPADTATERRRTQTQCGRLLAAWQVNDPQDLLPALRERGFLNLGEFVHTVRAHLDFLTGGHDPAVHEAAVHDMSVHDMTVHETAQEGLARDDRVPRTRAVAA